MEREHLYRGKRVDNGQWIYGDLLTSNGTCCEISDWNAVDYSRHDVDPETVGQYTGMTDKNGTKIFEGDIVKEKHKVHERIYSIIWRDDCFSMSAQTKHISYYLDEIISSHCEVIGNIYDNKELLK